MLNRFNSLVLIIAIFCLLPQNIIGQTNHHTIDFNGYYELGKTYRTWITTSTYSFVSDGPLKQIGDSLIVLPDLTNYNRTIEIKNIEEMYYREEGKVGKGFLFGALGGFVLGSALGFFDASGGDFQFLSPEQSALIAGVGLAIPGTLIGGLIGAIRIKIPINRN